MKKMLNRILSSEFLTFNEVLRLKVSIVTIFLFVFVFLSIPISQFSDFSWDVSLFVPIGFILLLFLTILLTVANLNRFAMHFSILTIIALTIFYISGSNHFYAYILFFVTLTVIIFYQDILTYLLYGGAISILGSVYLQTQGDFLVGINSADVGISTLSYQAILIGFYLVFLVQFIVSDQIYEKLNNEWGRMNKYMEQYQDVMFSHVNDLKEKHHLKNIWDNINFQKAVNEIAVFINEFFEKQGDEISEVVEFYFFLHHQEIEHIVEDKSLPILTRKYAIDLNKYLFNNRSEIFSILIEFGTLLEDDKTYSNNRYKYNLDELFDDKIDKLLALAILYKYLKTEVTKYDRFGKMTERLTHDEITELFMSKPFREFISFEQVNFYLDNEELFNDNL